MQHNEHFQRPGPTNALHGRESAFPIADFRPTDRGEADRPVQTAWGHVLTTRRRVLMKDRRVLAGNHLS